jgi:hypothetical protein
MQHNFAITMDEDTSFSIDGIPQVHSLSAKADQYQSAAQQQQQQHQQSIHLMPRVFSGSSLLSVNTSTSPTSCQSSTSPLIERNVSDQSTVSLGASSRIGKLSAMDTSLTPKVETYQTHAQPPVVAKQLSKSSSTPALVSNASLPRIESDISMSSNFISSPESAKESSDLSPAKGNLDMLVQAASLCSSSEGLTSQGSSAASNSKLHRSHTIENLAAAANEFNRSAMVKEDAASTQVMKSKLPSGLKTFNAGTYLVSEMRQERSHAYRVSVLIVNRFHASVRLSFPE